MLVLGEEYQVAVMLLPPLDVEAVAYSCSLVVVVVLRLRWRSKSSQTVSGSRLAR
jgi:hypothetical protein